jgi:hypothetical protein
VRSVTDKCNGSLRTVQYSTSRMQGIPYIMVSLVEKHCIYIAVACRACLHCDEPGGKHCIYVNSRMQGVLTAL